MSNFPAELYFFPQKTIKERTKVFLFVSFTPTAEFVLVCSSEKQITALGRAAALTA